MSRRRLAAITGITGIAAVAAWGPAVASLQPVRVGLTPRLLPAGLSGVSERRHVALTFDDGPDSASTPAFLDLLERYGVRATFFVLGEHAGTERLLLQRTVAAGHEIGVHGWTHRGTPFLRPGLLATQLRRTRELVEDLTGTRVRHYRPPYGLLSTETLLAGRAAGLRTVLWSAWGRDWERSATPERILATVDRTLRPGGTVLLHDSDRTSAPGSWRRTLPATDRLLQRAAGDGLELGPLAEHW